MKRAANKQRGGILFAMLTIIGVVGLMLVTYLSLVSQRARAVSRSQSWNLCVPVAEAGLEEAMAHLNQTQGRNMAGVNPATHSNGWVTIGANTYTKPFDFPWGRCSLRIDNTNFPPAETLGAIESTGFVKVYGATGEVSRRFRITTRFRPQIEGIVAQTKVTIQDFAMADSYDSRVAPYDPLTARDNTFVGNNSTMAGEMLIKDNAKVYGEVGAGSPTGIIATPPAKVGDKAFVDDPFSLGTIEAGHSSGDLSAPISAVDPPFSGAGTVPSAGSHGGTNYTYLLEGGNYKVEPSLTMDKSETMMVTQESALWILDTFTIKDDVRIFIAPGARLRLYMQKQFYCLDNARINVDGRPEQFSYYGLNNNAEFYMSGNSQMNGTVYAPQAKMDVSGDAQMCGGGSCAELVMKGNFKFHYDESLAASRGQPFLITSWTEF